MKTKILIVSVLVSLNCMAGNFMLDLADKFQRASEYLDRKGMELEKLKRKVKIKYASLKKFGSDWYFYCGLYELKNTKKGIILGNLISEGSFKAPAQLTESKSEAYPIQLFPPGVGKDMVGYLVFKRRRTETRNSIEFIIEDQQDEASRRVQFSSLLVGVDFNRTDLTERKDLVVNFMLPLINPRPHVVLRSLMCVYHHPTK